ncbi:MAG: NAD-dependent epimerase/dehydratase family protein [Bryobacterales bacterium]|nr:NAD-dependent epimerase/dehydratase family protein [Bryobacterales bacterium]
MARNVAVVAGASGLVGGYLLRVLLEDAFFDSIIAIGRRNVPFEHPKLMRKIADFATLRGLDAPGATHVFCALGTTIRKAGSRQAFRQVDHQAVLNLARAGVEQGARRFLVVSSVGASPKSRNFYLRVKGEMERDVASLPFEAVHIFQPSLLLGLRAEKRPGEQIGAAIARALEWMLAGALRKYRPISAARVAQAMAVAAERGKSGVNIHQFDDIQRLSG